MDYNKLTKTQLIDKLQQVGETLAGCVEVVDKMSGGYSYKSGILQEKIRVVVEDILRIGVESVDKSGE